MNKNKTGGRRRPWWRKTTGVEMNWQVGEINYHKHASCVSWCLYWCSVCLVFNNVRHIAMISSSCRHVLGLTRNHWKQQAGHRDGTHGDFIDIWLRYEFPEPQLESPPSYYTTEMHYHTQSITELLSTDASLRHVVSLFNTLPRGFKM